MEKYKALPFFGKAYEDVGKVKEEILGALFDTVNIRRQKIEQIQPVINVVVTLEDRNFPVFQKFLDVLKNQIIGMFSDTFENRRKQSLVGRLSNAFDRSSGVDDDGDKLGFLRRRHERDSERSEMNLKKLEFITYEFVTSYQILNQIMTFFVTRYPEMSDATELIKSDVEGLLLDYISGFMETNTLLHLENNEILIRISEMLSKIEKFMSVNMEFVNIEGAVLQKYGEVLRSSFTSSLEKLPLNDPADLIHDFFGDVYSHRMLNVIDLIQKNFTSLLALPFFKKIKKQIVTIIGNYVIGLFGTVVDKLTGFDAQPDKLNDESCKVRRSSFPLWLVG